MKNVIILCGGKSAEHDVSFLSARSVLENLDRQKYALTVLGIDKQGRAYPSLEVKERLGLSEREGLHFADGHDWVEFLRERDASECVVFPVLHGPFGEDGTVQGLLEILGLPYVGAAVSGSAVAMDKAHCKAILHSAGLPVLPWSVVDWLSWNEERSQSLARAVEGFGFPVFVKPVNMGSSIGVSRASDIRALEEALEVAFRYDDYALVEQGIEAREIELSVLGSFQPRVSIPGEIEPGDEFYNYEAKYLKDTSRLLIPAPVSESEARRLQELAVKVFQALHLEGMARVDFLMDRKSGEIWVNEPNTIPGFTKISMYPKLWEASGLSYSRLLDELVGLALRRQDRKRRLSVDR